MRSPAPALGALVLALFLAGTTVAAATVPPAPDRWVTDQVGLLSPAAAAQLDQRLEAYQARTGHQVIVWVGAGVGNEALESWAANTFKAWGIGRKGHDDGVALFILAQDRRTRIEVGYGLEGQLTDLAAARILREELTPRLQQGHRDEAVVAAVNGVLAALGGEAPGAAPALAPVARPVEQPISKWQLLVMAGLGILVLLFLVTHPRMAAALLFTLSSNGRRGGGGWGGGGGYSGGGGGFSGGGGSSGGGGASGSW